GGECGHVRIVALSRCDRREGRMMSSNESIVSFLMSLQIFLDPPQLLGPKRVPARLIRCGGGKLAVDDGEVAVAPIERIVRTGLLKDVVNVVGSTFVISDCWKEGSLTQEVLFDAEENRPLCAGCSVFHHVAGLDYKIRERVLHDLSHDALMHIVARPIVSGDQKRVRFAGCRWRLERSLAGIS